MKNLGGIVKTLQNIMRKDPGVSGDAQRIEELKDFVDKKLFPSLRKIDVSTGSKRALIVREVFEGTNNYMKNGTILRQVLNELELVDFNASEDRHLFGDIYETILRTTIGSRFQVSCYF